MEATTNANFQNYTNRVGFNLMDHTDAGTTYQYAQKFTGGFNAQVGVAKSYKVYAGDKVKIEAWGKYTNPTSNSSNIAGFASALLAAFGVPAPAGGETATISSALNTWGGLVAAGSGGSNGSGPKAFVNIIVFDKNYKLLDAAWDGVNPAASQVGATPVVPHDYMMQEYTIKEEGYVFMYVSNENTTLADMYFDDIAMTHTKGNVIQYNEYYPYGLQTAKSWTRENSTGNNFLYNGGVELNAASGWYDTFFRGYDPALGRFMQADPLAAASMSWSPYHYAKSDPVTFNDPLGDRERPPDDRNRNNFGIESVCWVCQEKLSLYGLRDLSSFAGSGYYWSDGIGFSDWSANGGSQLFRNGLASGLTSLGGNLYSVAANGAIGKTYELNGSLWKDNTYIVPTSSEDYANGATTPFNPVVVATEILLRQNNGIVLQAGFTVEQDNKEKLGTKATDWINVGSFFIGLVQTVNDGVIETSTVKLSTTLQAGRAASRGLGVAGLGITYFDLKLSKEVSSAHILDGAFGIIGLIPGSGTFIGGAYFIGNAISILSSQNSIGQHLDNYLTELAVKNVQIELRKQGLIE